MFPLATSTGLPTVLLLQSLGGVQSLILLCHTSTAFEGGRFEQGVKHKVGQNGVGLNLNSMVFRHDEKELPSSVIVPTKPLQTSVVPSQPQSPEHETRVPFTYGATVNELLTPGQV